MSTPTPSSHNTPAKRPDGNKNDAGKRRWSLLPTGTISQIIDVLEFGAAKYGVTNWRNVPDAHQRYYDALLRHIDAWWQGETNDPETRQHHLAHAACCILFLLALTKKADPHSHADAPQLLNQKHD